MANIHFFIFPPLVTLSVNNLTHSTKKAQQVGGSHHQKHHTPRKNKFFADLFFESLAYVINNVFLIYFTLLNRVVDDPMATL
ncbi:hypothetical protein KZ773_25005 [Escherichia coli]|nr:hypothetical protein [Escherichia coli]